MKTFNKISILLVFFIISNISAQFQVGKSYLGPSIGFFFEGSTVQFGANYEYGMKWKDVGDIGIGGIFRYWSWSAGYWSYTGIAIGAQANYHFKVSDKKWDPFAGITLSYNVGTADWDGAYNWGETSSYGGLYFGLHGGARYWVSPTLAIVGRIGFASSSYSSLDVGVDFKF